MLQKLPVTESGFELIRTENMLYVDKTKYILDLLDMGRYLFLSRPRRFGKSLLTNTLKALFQNKKHLFEDLYIYDKWTWTEHSVIHLDFSKIDYKGTIEQFETDVSNILNSIASEYDIKLNYTTCVTQFRELIDELKEKFNKGEVVLIDEYDKPITDFIDNPTKANENREFLRTLYTTLKAEHENLRLVFVTGVSKLAKVSVFSGMNNTVDVSLRPKMNNILGITHDELRHYFKDYIEVLRQKKGMSYSEVMDKIKFMYNGYSWDAVETVYNPYAIVNLMAAMDFNNFWFQSGTPTLLVNLIVQRAKEEALNTQPTDYENVLVGNDVFETSELEHLSVEGLLFQTGYLTITKIEEDEDYFFKSYTLNYPNYEVKYSFMKQILERYAALPKREIQTGSIRMKQMLRTGKIDNFIQLIQRFFSIIPYQLRYNANEAYYHSILQMLFTLVGIEMLSERATYNGRIDGVIEFEKQVYILEFKYAQKGKVQTLANKALQQIKDKNYAKSYQQTDKNITLIGIGFLDKKRKETKDSQLEIKGIWESVD